jgi:DNA-binding response OmpR family regulator
MEKRMSEAGTGTGETRSPRRSHSRRAGQRRGGIRKPGILIVEAEILVRHPLAEYLRECGYRVFEASSPTVAREFLTSRPADIDVVLANIDASQKSGFTLAAWVRSNLPKIEMVLASTIKKAAEKAGKLCEEGPALAKPYDHQLVLNHIRQLLAARDRNKPKK